MIKQPMRYQNWLLAGAVIALAVFPLVFVRGKYSGSDNQGKDAISTLQPDYQPWFKSPFVPASPEIEGMLFACQAALGAGIVGYVIGLYKGRTQAQQLQDQQTSSAQHEPSD